MWSIAKWLGMKPTCWGTATASECWKSMNEQDPGEEFARDGEKTKASVLAADESIAIAVSER